MSRKGLFGIQKKPLTKTKKNSFRPPLPPKGKMTSKQNTEPMSTPSDRDEVANMLEYIKTGDRNCIIKPEDKLSTNDLMKTDRLQTSYFSNKGGDEMQGGYLSD